MKGPPPPIGEDDLQAWIDGRLSPERSVFVEAFLAEQPEIGARLARDRQQRDALRRALESKVQEPIPARLRLANIRVNRRSRTTKRLRAGAAALLLFLAGAGAGWLAGSRAVPERPALVSASLVSRDALSAYRTYVVEVVHPVEVPAENEKHLLAWLSKRLGRPLAAPNLGAFGYVLMGGRLLPADAGAAAQLMYQDGGGRRLTLYIQAADGTETAFRYFGDGQVSTLAWLDRGFGFAVTAPLPRDRLLPIAEAVYRGLEEETPTAG